MKILFLSINHAPEKTGIGKYQGEMARWFIEQGHQVHCVTAPPYYPEWAVQSGYKAWAYKTETLDGAKVTRVPLYVPKNPGGLKRLIHLTSFGISCLPVMLWRAFKDKPDAILMTAPPLMAAPAALLAAKIGRARSILHIQDFEVDAAFELGLLKNPKLKKLALWFERKALGAFDIVSTISPNMQKRLMDKGLPENKTALVPNWANIDMFDALPKDTANPWLQKYKGENPDAILAVYSGNLGQKQGLETIVEVAQILNISAPYIQFIISGDGAGREAMVKQAEGLNNITFVPLQPFEDFLHLMVAADMHLLPQKAGAADLVMPSKLGNILSSGRPVIVGAPQGTQVHSAIEECGLAVEPENATEFADAILTLAKDEKERELMGKAARARAERDWGKESLLKRMESLLKN